MGLGLLLARPGLEQTSSLLSHANSVRHMRGKSKVFRDEITAGFVVCSHCLKMLRVRGGYCCPVAVYMTSREWKPLSIVINLQVVKPAGQATVCLV